MRVPRMATCLSLGLVLLAACMAAAQAPTRPVQGGVLPAPGVALPAQSAGLPVQGGSLDLLSDLVRPLLLAVVFTAVGLLLFFACIFLIVRLAPFSVRREIEEDQNVAVGIIVGSMILGIAIILAAALLG
ncbi:MAG: DUF350 domain-containing protein [Pirellulaceae bacterium]|nr:DUF350 domain-containing protein [Pirellulaceae bacterium]